MSFPSCVACWIGSTVLVWHPCDCRIVPGPRASLSANPLMPGCSDNVGLWVTHGIVSEVPLTQWWADFGPEGWRLIDSVEMLTANTYCRAGSWASGQQETVCWDVTADQRQVTNQGWPWNTRGHKARNDNRIYRGVDMVFDQYQKLKEYFTKWWGFWFLALPVARL